MLANGNGAKVSIHQASRNQAVYGRLSRRRLDRLQSHHYRRHVLEAYTIQCMLTDLSQYKRFDYGKVIHPNFGHIRKAPDKT